MSIERWISKEFERQEKIPSLEAALLDRSFLRYIRYRLQIFFWRIIAAVAIHAAEFPFIYKSIHPGNITPILLFAAVMQLVSQWWWGVLEVMRTEVRTAVDQEQTHNINKVIAPWLRLSMFIAVALFAGGLCLSTFLCFRARAPIVSPEQAVMLIYLIRTVCNIPIGTYHSGIYAIRRVARPVFVVFLVV